MYWVDKIAKEIIDSGKYKPYWVDDMKTPSGFAHVGSLRGPLIHSFIYRALRDAGKSAKFTYVSNDFDPADELPEEFREKYKKYLGFPLRKVPSPDKIFDSMGSYLANVFNNVLVSLGVEAKFLSSWDMYHKGKFDGVIKVALDSADKIQDVYQKVSGSKKKEQGWLPFQVICEKCGKLGTTKVFAWDGKEVTYKCEPDMVSWAKGCGYKGRISPFGGTGKLPWKVDWAAHWKVIEVTIEGAGKDHASAGGSYDIAMELCDEVFHCHRPYKLPYEWLLFGGKKMSSSKGIGFKAHQIVEMIPPSVVRFMVARSDYRQASNFDPVNSMAIPDLFDEYDKCWKAHITGSNEAFARMFELSQINKVPDKKEVFLPRFRDIAHYLQLPNVNIENKFVEAKGSALTEVELKIIGERIRYARIWLEKYAPGDFKSTMTDSIPEEVRNLTQDQKKYLKEIAMLVKNAKNPEDLQAAVYNLAREQKVDIKKAFAAIYLSLIGKDHGPKAGWLLLQYPQNKVIKRLNEASKAKTQLQSTTKVSFIQIPSYFTIDQEVKKRYPSISVGVALLRDVNIRKENTNLNKEIKGFLELQKGLTTELLDQFPEIASYRKLYREMSIDWHSRRPGPEELLRRVALKKTLYNVNTCVDAYNLVVMKNHISVGAFDADKIKFPTILRFAIEGDEILLLGNNEPTKYTSRELAYYDQVGGYNTDFNYRDAQRTMVTENTRNLWINVDGIYDATPDKVEKSLDESVEKILKYCGGKVEFKGLIA